MGNSTEALRPLLDDGQWLRLLRAGRDLSGYTVWTPELAIEVLAKAILASNRAPSEALYQAVRKVSGREPWDFDGTSMAWLAGIPAPGPRSPTVWHEAAPARPVEPPYILGPYVLGPPALPVWLDELREFLDSPEYKRAAEWASRRADDSKGVSYRLPWHVRAWARIRFWLKL